MKSLFYNQNKPPNSPRRNEIKNTTPKNTLATAKVLFQDATPKEASFALRTQFGTQAQITEVLPTTKKGAGRADQNTIASFKVIFPDSKGKEAVVALESLYGKNVEISEVIPTHKNTF